MNVFVSDPVAISAILGCTLVTAVALIYGRRLWMIAARRKLEIKTDSDSNERT